MNDPKGATGKMPLDLCTFGAGLRDFLEIFERHFDGVSATLLDTAAMMPGLGRFFPRSDRAAAQLRLRLSHKLVRRAILQGEWEPLLEVRREQGRSYAASAVPVEEVIEIFASFKDLLVPHLVEAFGADPARLIGALHAIDRYVRFTFSAVLDAYVAPTPIQPIGRPWRGKSLPS
jgi:hypothetical protein